MFLYKNNRTDIRIRPYECGYIGEYIHACTGVYRQDLIVVSTYVIQNKLIAAFLSNRDLYNFYRSPI